MIPEMSLTDTSVGQGHFFVLSAGTGLSVRAESVSAGQTGADAFGSDRMSLALALAARVKLMMNRPQALLIDMRVLLRRLDAGVPQQFLDGAQIRASG